MDEFMEVWEADGLNVIVPLDADGTEFVVRMLSPRMATLVAAAPELARSLYTITGWLEGTEAFAESHGAHSDAVEARKLLARLSEAVLWKGGAP